MVVVITMQWCPSTDVLLMIMSEQDIPGPTTTTEDIPGPTTTIEDIPGPTTSTEKVCQTEVRSC